MKKCKLLNLFVMFFIAGLLGALLSGVLSSFAGNLYAKIGSNAAEVLGWGLWPVKFAGMGLGELSNPFWLMLGMLNAVLFSLLGLLAGVLANTRMGFLASYIVFVTIILFWCLWLSGFSANTWVYIATITVLLFYSSPFYFCWLRGEK